MKKILLLGGSSQQIIAIETAKKLGYITILCDYLPDNPGQHYADKFYLVSTTDKQAVLNVALKERVSGVLAYASDPAAPTAAYVATKLGLPSNPLESVEILCNKDRFRIFLEENDFSVPKSASYSDLVTAEKDLANFTFPVIIKPVDSSGSKGITVLYSIDGAQRALSFAFSFSRKRRIVVEEFIQKSHPYLIGGDIFVIDGEIKLWGLLNCHRDPLINPLVPIGKSFPLQLEQTDYLHVKQTLQTVIDKLQIRFGALNVELIIDQSGHVIPVDIGPRCGGNMIPELLGYIFNINLVELSILSAMGAPITIANDLDIQPYYATHNLHSRHSGVFQEVRFSDELESHIVRKCIYKRTGDPVDSFNNASHSLGVLFLKFDESDSMNQMLNSINNHIHIILAP